MPLTNDDDTLIQLDLFIMDSDIGEILILPPPAVAIIVSHVMLSSERRFRRLRIERKQQTQFSFHSDTHGSWLSKLLANGSSPLWEQLCEWRE